MKWLVFVLLVLLIGCSQPPLVGQEKFHPLMKLENNKYYQITVNYHNHTLDRWPRAAEMCAGYDNRVCCPLSEWQYVCGPKHIVIIEYPECAPKVSNISSWNYNYCQTIYQMTEPNFAEVILKSTES